MSLSACSGVTDSAEIDGLGCQLLFPDLNSISRTPSHFPIQNLNFHLRVSKNQISSFQLKRKQVQLESKYEGVAPKLVLLSLLAECCMVTTTQTQVRYQMSVDV